MNRNYSAICSHERLSRINDNFVRCLSCGQSLISQVNITGNKSRSDFTNENRAFTRNFDRNFSNELEEIDNINSTPLYEMYTDMNRINQIIVNRLPLFNSDPPKFEVTVNGEKNYLTNENIQKMLYDIRAVRIR